jgi:serine/threonine protein kinase
MIGQNRCTLIGPSPQQEEVNTSEKNNRTKMSFVNIGSRGIIVIIGFIIITASILISIVITRDMDEYKTSDTRAVDESKASEQIVCVPEDLRGSSNNDFVFVPSNFVGFQGSTKLFKYRSNEERLYIEKISDSADKEINILRDLQGVKGVIRISCSNPDRKAHVSPFYSDKFVIENSEMDMLRYGFAQIILSLEGINKAGYAHMDVHLGNIVMTGSRTVLIDLGQGVKFSEEDQSICSCCYFAAPETRTAQTARDLVKADIYQTGKMYLVSYFGTPNAEDVNGTNYSKEEQMLLDLLKKMTVENMSERITFNQIKEHQFFKG